MCVLVNPFFFANVKAIRGGQRGALAGVVWADCSDSFLLKQIAVSAGPFEANLFVSLLVDQNPIGFYVTVPSTFPIPDQGMILRRFGQRLTFK